MASGFEYFPGKPAAAGDQFIVEDLLDFSHDDGGAWDGLAAGNSNSTESSSSSIDVTPALDSCNSFSVNNDFDFSPPADFPFSDDLYVPHDDLAELEWLSNFVEESFTSDEFQKLHLTSGMSATKTRPEKPLGPGLTRTNGTQRPIFDPEMPVPGKARSKRTRVAGPGNWASRLAVLSTDVGLNDPSDGPLVRGYAKKRAEGGPGPSPASGGDQVRKCLHCATEKTPQWRAGPMGPKTLCNACGVRYKSGRLVPEYRPAASPTFIQTKHSNSHRKVVELRRQKELSRQEQYHHKQLLHHMDSTMILDQSNNNNPIHQQMGPNYRQLI